MDLRHQLHLLLYPGPVSGHEKLTKYKKLVDRDSDGLLFMNINVVEGLSCDLILW